MNDIFTPIVVKDKIKVEPKNLNSKIDWFILSKIKKLFEGKCSRHGYIKHDSIKIVSKDIGRINDVSLNGDVVYDICFEAQICNPQINSNIKAVVVNTNQWGILAESYITINQNKIPVLEVIIAKRDKDYSNIKIGDIINVIVKGKKIELNDTRMIIMGIINDDMQTQSILHIQEEEDKNDEIDEDDIDGENIETRSTHSKVSEDDTETESEKSEEEDIEEDIVSDIGEEDVDDDDDDVDDDEIDGEEYD